MLELSYDISPGVNQVRGGGTWSGGTLRTDGRLFAMIPLSEGNYHIWE